jgi:lipid-A-disaccharide synthase
MLDKDRRYRVFISVAEPSADAHCAGLIEAVCKKGHENVDFVGVGGPKMADAGCEILEMTVGRAVMTYKAFAEVFHFYRLIRRIRDYLRNNEVDLAVICDSPGHNWHVAKAAKKLGIKTLYYVAPQLWAWGGFRIGKLRRCCDKLCCILPFELEWFGSRGIDTTYVGNPMVDGIRIASERSGEYERFESDKLRVALMPGSREAELKDLWGPMQQIAMRLKGTYPKTQFSVVAVDQERRDALRAREIPGFDCEYQIGTVNETAEKVDFSVVASGSATLEVAAAGCPMVIMYQSSRLLWHLAGRHIVKTRYLSLVNILARKELVPEFMPYFASIEPIVASIEQLLSDRSELVRISRELTELVKPLASKEASGEVADILVEMLQDQPRCG